MLSLEKATVQTIDYEDDGIQLISVLTGGTTEKCINYIEETGRCNPGNHIIINTIGTRLKLGTGGYSIVYFNESINIENNYVKDKSHGHIIKMKYTPIQHRVKSIEEIAEYRDIFDKKHHFDGYPVLFAVLHSMVAPVAAVLKYNRPDIKINCLYTYGGAVCSKHSFTLAALKNRGLVDSITTCGECYGGDYDCINVYSGIIFAFEVLKSDVCIVCCGPGIAGTSSFYGFSTLDFVLPVYCANNLGCTPIMIPRISFTDKRERHYGLSMQTIALLDCLNFPVNVPISIDEGLNHINTQLKNHSLDRKHRYVYLKEYSTKNALDAFEINAEVMGRKYNEDSCYFKNCGAAGEFALKLISIQGGTFGIQ